MADSADVVKYTQEAEKENRKLEENRSTFLKLDKVVSGLEAEVKKMAGEMGKIEAEIKKLQDKLNGEKRTHDQKKAELDLSNRKLNSLEIEISNGQTRLATHLRHAEEAKKKIEKMVKEGGRK